MRLNENIALSAPQVLLVPYDPHHVPRYHEWMEDPAIREATASDRLTLAEEYENQTSWREAPDKLTFIICEPLMPHDGTSEDLGTDYAETVVAGEADSPGRMIGDVNLFLTPWDGDDGEEQGQGKAYVNAEIDIMIADPRHRGRGLGRATLTAFLLFIRSHLDGILAEYAGASSEDANGNGSSTPELKDVVAKINAGNQSSIKLFKSMGFSQRGGVNYFGEIEMVLEGLGVKEGKVGEELAGTAATSECFYDRSRLKE
ncbi:GNAT domain-containing protein [Hypoxylon rubiginosum]|uniref:GNAT domain-containing protein n=1 Tax=Hypoxylon rubiginosum TaxID=110542 RepID=A0ACB9YZ73_9PEZI|nr:GNAT domain-containing protein [Hypoxylon rubiginosum]